MKSKTFTSLEAYHELERSVKGMLQHFPFHHIEGLEKAAV
jgi:hypothetical protein